MGRKWTAYGLSHEEAGERRRVPVAAEAAGEARVGASGREDGCGGRRRRISESSSLVAQRRGRRRRPVAAAAAVAHLADAGIWAGTTKRAKSNQTQN